MKDTQIALLVALGVGGYLVYSAMNKGTGNLDALAKAITAQEGGAVADRNMRNNNPGNLKYVEGLNRPGYVLSDATGKDSAGFAVFPDLNTGYDAMRRQIAIDAEKYPGLTLQGLVNVWLGGKPDDPASVPKSEGDPLTYAANVAKSLGVSVSTAIDSFFNG